MLSWARLKICTTNLTDEDNKIKSIMLLPILLLIILGISCDNKNTNPAVESSDLISSTPAFSDMFDDPQWEKNNGTTLWQQASWMQNGTQMNSDRCQAVNGLLTLTVLPGEPYQGGSIQTRSDQWHYGRWDARLKPSSVPGVLNSMFTDDWNGKTYEEVDVEFLTYTFGEKSGSVHLALHREGQTNYWWEDVPLSFNPSDTFHVWSIQILPDSVSWFVDQQLLRTFVYNDEFKLQAPYQFFFNAWTKEEWINGPPTRTADYHIDWVKFFPYKISD
jgi:endo-1,3-1,4-beta-glycanase ExoK